MRPTVAALVAGLCATFAACGAAGPGHPAAAAPVSRATGSTSAVRQSPRACRAASAGEIASVARRIYRQAVDGRNVVSAVRRLTSSRSLRAAVAAGDARSTRSALAPLLKHQVVRLQVFDTRRRLVSIGTTPAFAPVRATLREPGGAPVGHLLLAVTGDRSYVGITRRLTGADVVFHHGAHVLVSSLRGRAAAVPDHGTLRSGGTTYGVTTIRTHAYPSGPTAVTLLIPPASPAVCGTNAADTRLRTIGAIGRRLFAAEQDSPSVQRTLRYAAGDPAFRRAAASGDPVALRAAVVGFFRIHRFHIVRVRLSRGDEVVYDLGGPYVLAPASRDVRAPDGRPAGRFSLAVQDDTGYIKLMHRFTGAAVQLRTPRGLVPGSTLAPGPAVIPDHGDVAYAGRRYLADSFSAVAFPSGSLRVSLLVPEGPA